MSKRLLEQSTGLNGGLREGWRRKEKNAFGVQIKIQNDKMIKWMERE